MVLKVLLDSTYLLPTFGIEVKGLDEEDIKMLRELAEGKVKYYCASVVWIEILGKIYKEAQKRNIDIDSLVEIAIDSLLNSGLYSWIQPSAEALKLAFKLRKEGHKDLIDNILYSVAKIHNMIFLTMDSALISFLRKNNYDTENVMTHKKLIILLTEKKNKQTKY